MGFEDLTDTESFDTTTEQDATNSPLQVPDLEVEPVQAPDWATGANPLQVRTEILEDLSFWFEQTGTTCGPASLTSIIEDFTGRNFVNEFQVRDWAAANGHYKEGFGMLDDGAVATLEHFGVPAHQETGDWATVDRYLEQGRAVVLSVDAGEYWGNADVPDNSYHYVRVLDIDLDRGVATLSDTGMADGRGRGVQVPLTVLGEAWDESDERSLRPEDRATLINSMIVSDVVDPDGVGAPWYDADTADTAQTTGFIDPRQGFALLPIMVSRAGLEALQAASRA
jgi:hypothetical protein